MERRASFLLRLVRPAQAQPLPAESQASPPHGGGSGGLTTTSHPAWVRDRTSSWRALDSGVRRESSSGGRPAMWEGAKLLALSLKRRARRIRKAAAAAAAASGATSRYGRLTDELLEFVKGGAAALPAASASGALGGDISQSNLPQLRKKNRLNRTAGGASSVSWLWWPRLV